MTLPFAKSGNARKHLCGTQPAACGPAAFTLIELLVVIAIVSLLASILLPSLNRAKFLTRRVICITNLKQVGTTWGMYWSEHKGILPCSYGEKHYFAWGGFDTGELRGDAPPIDHRPLASYIDVDGSYKCPEDGNSGAIGSGPIWKGWGTSYGYNTYVSWGPNSINRLTQASQPTRTIFIGDTTMYMADPVYEGRWPGWEGNFTWHSNSDWRQNILFLDMHVEFILVDGVMPEGGDGYVWEPI